MRTKRSSGDAVRAPAPGFVWCLALAAIGCALAGLVAGRAGLLEAAHGTLLELRACRVATAWLCGGALALAGAVVQTLFRNPLASPEILGVSSGATLGAHLALLVSVFALRGQGALGLLPEMLIPVGATAGALLALLVLLTVLALREGPLSLLLTGYALMALFSGASAFLTSLTQQAWELNRAFSALSQGDISGTGPRQVLLVLVMTLGGALPVLLHHDTLDLLLTSEDEARSLGVDVTRARGWLVVWVALLIAGAVAVGGSVAFVGLIVPHALRPWVGVRHRYLLPLAFVAGASFVVLCDVACRIAPTSQSVPLGIFTSFIGAPIFLRMLRKQLRRQVAYD
jgi:iron complex transport system permease protein